MANRIRIVVAVAAFWSVGIGSLLVAQDAKNTTPAAQAEEKKPSEVQLLRAQVIKLQLEYLELQKQMATCQQQNLSGAAKAHEEDVLKSVGAKPGQKFDWNTMSVTPVPPAAPVEAPKAKP